MDSNTEVLEFNKFYRNWKVFMKPQFFEDIF